MNTHNKNLMRAKYLFALFFLIYWNGNLFCQNSDSSHSPDDILTIGGEVESPLTLSMDDLKALPRQSAMVKDHDGNEATYEGVPLLTLLRKAGATLGKNLRGKALLNYMIAEAGDGYRVLYAIPEIDSEFTGNLVLLADMKDGKPLSEKDGPLQIINTAEQRHARWVRGVRSLMIKKAD